MYRRVFVTLGEHCIEHFSQILTGTERRTTISSTSVCALQSSHCAPSRLPRYREGSRASGPLEPLDLLTGRKRCRERPRQEPAVPLVACHGWRGRRAPLGRPHWKGCAHAGVRLADGKEGRRRRVSASARGASGHASLQLSGAGSARRVVFQRGVRSCQFLFLILHSVSLHAFALHTSLVPRLLSPTMLGPDAFTTTLQRCKPPPHPPLAPQHTPTHRLPPAPG